MSKTRQQIEETLRKLEQQDQQNKNLVNLIQNTNHKDLEQERFKNMSDDEKRLMR